jgi:hypothetical protein
MRREQEDGKAGRKRKILGMRKQENPSLNLPVFPPSCCFSLKAHMMKR